MKPIKFRAWNKKLKIMKDVQRIFLNENVIEVYADTDEFETCVWYLNDCVLMQFITELDADGNEIYDGDILTDNRVIEWCKGAPCPGWYVDYGIQRDDKVIGNIWENPELIE